jgi:hypothetical protein
MINQKIGKLSNMITIKRLENLQVWSQSKDWKTFKYDHNKKIGKPSSMITMKRLENLQVWSQSKDWKTFKYDHNQ